MDDIIYVNPYTGYYDIPYCNSPEVQKRYHKTCIKLCNECKRLIEQLQDDEPGFEDIGITMFMNQILNVNSQLKFILSRRKGVNT